MNRFDSLSRGRRIALLAGLCLLGLLITALLAEGAVRVRQTLRHGGTTRIESLYYIDQESQLRLPVAGYTSDQSGVTQKMCAGTKEMGSMIKLK